MIRKSLIYINTICLPLLVFCLVLFCGLYLLFNFIYPMSDDPYLYVFIDRWDFTKYYFGITSIKNALTDFGNIFALPYQLLSKVLVTPLREMSYANIKNAIDLGVNSVVDFQKSIDVLNKGLANLNILNILKILYYFLILVFRAFMIFCSGLFVVIVWASTFLIYLVSYLVVSSYCMLVWLFRIVTGSYNTPLYHSPIWIDIPRW